MGIIEQEVGIAEIGAYFLERREGQLVIRVIEDGLAFWRS